MRYLYYIILALLVLGIYSCDKHPVEKPENLIGRNQMIDMLVDIHIAEATYNHMKRDSIIQKSSSQNFYHSILNKYQVPDSLFEKSFTFYASNPKQFEKLYQDIMNRLSELEQEYSGRKNELLELEEFKK